jgi:hypothetical protein
MWWHEHCFIRSCVPLGQILPILGAASIGGLFVFLLRKMRNTALRLALAS